MSEDFVISMGAEAIKTMLYLAGPLLLVAMVIGIVVSVLQAITQINEATLTFIPKMVGIILVLAIMAPWMLHVMQDYSAMVFGNVGDWVR
jgi:flagellar biosynthetic protein FliQ